MNCSFNLYVNFLFWDPKYRLFLQIIFFCFRCWLTHIQRFNQLGKWHFSRWYLVFWTRTKRPDCDCTIVVYNGSCCSMQVGSVIKNPEIASLVPTLLMALTDPNEYTKHSLDILLQVSCLFIFLFTSLTFSSLIGSHAGCYGYRQLSLTQLMHLHWHCWCL